MTLLQLFGSKIKFFIHALLVLSNVISLYFIIDLLLCDEIVGYFSNDEIIYEDLHETAWLFLINGALNLFFISVLIFFKILYKTDYTK